VDGEISTAGKCQCYCATPLFTRPPEISDSRDIPDGPATAIEESAPPVFEEVTVPPEPSLSPVPSIASTLNFRQVNPEKEEESIEPSPEEEESIISTSSQPEVTVTPVPKVIEECVQSCRMHPGPRKF